MPRLRRSPRSGECRNRDSNRRTGCCRQGYGSGKGGFAWRAMQINTQGPCKRVVQATGTKNNIRRVHCGPRMQCIVITSTTFFHFKQIITCNPMAATGTQYIARLADVPWSHRQAKQFSPPNQPQNAASHWFWSAELLPFAGEELSLVLNGSKTGRQGAIAWIAGE